MVHAHRRAPYALVRMLTMTLGLVTTACVYFPDKATPDLHPGDITGVVVGVPPGAAGEVRTLAGARVQRANSAIVRSTRDDGRFYIRNLPEGDHVLMLTYDPD